MSTLLSNPSDLDSAGGIKGNSASRVRCLSDNNTGRINDDKTLMLPPLVSSFSPDGAVSPTASTASMSAASTAAKSHSWKRETTHRIFANRNLHLAKIRFFGFDMDYTLAMYKSPDYETLSFQIAASRLVEKGYPAEITKYEYDPGFPIRGLWVDKQYGTLLKVDGFGNILTCAHGLRFLSAHEIYELYPNKFVQFDEKRFYVYNTLFNLPECYLFAVVVDYYTNLKDFEMLEDKTGVHSGEVLISYNSIFQSTRETTDWLFSGSDLPKITVARVKELVIKDSRLPTLLDRIRGNGSAKTFLLTNSGYTYTNAIMSYLLNITDEQGKVLRDWTSYFDHVFVDACKPLFFEGGTIMRAVHRQTGKLHIGVHVGQLQAGAVYSGGNCDQLCKMIGATGKDVMYIGDHIYSDILKTKKKNSYFKQIQDLDRAMGEAFRDFDSSSLVAPEIVTYQNQMREFSQRMEKEYGDFGSAFRCGPRPTFFANQITRFADLYAHTFLNLIYYPLFYLFRTPFVMMPHEATVDPERDEALEHFVHDHKLHTINRTRCPGSLRESTTPDASQS